MRLALVFVSTLLLVNLTFTVVVYRSYTVPHCSKVIPLLADVEFLNLDSAQVNITQHLQFELSLRKRVCFKASVPLPKLKPDYRRKIKKFVDNSATIKLLYTFEYVDVVQEYPVQSNWYQFGIPKIYNDCLCDCPGGELHCPFNYPHTSCDKGSDSTCIRVRFPHISAIECPSGTEASICCEFRMEPANNRKFFALTLGPPETFSFIRFIAYFYTNDSQITILENRTAVVPNSHEDEYLHTDDMTADISTVGKPDSLWGFMSVIAAADESNLVYLPREGILNDYRSSDFSKLGWFRYESDSWRVVGTNLENFVKLRGHSCRAQIYATKSLLEFTGDSPREFEDILTHRRIEQIYRQVDRVEFNPSLTSLTSTRHVRVYHKRGAKLKFSVSFTTKLHQVQLSYHESFFADFEAQIRLDENSHVYLNLTFYHGKGPLMCFINVVSGEDRGWDISASVSTMDDYERWALIKPLPEHINEPKEVCCASPTNAANRLCKMAEYSQTPLIGYVRPEVTFSGVIVGSCVNCNRFVDHWDLWNFWDIRSWFKGPIESIEDALGRAAKVLMFVGISLVSIIVFRRFLWPLINLAFSKKRRSVDVDRLIK